MANNKSGGIKTRDKNLARNPNHYRDAGKKGGKAFHHVPRGFAANKERASAAGKIGGRVTAEKTKAKLGDGYYMILAARMREARNKKAAIPSQRIAA